MLPFTNHQDTARIWINPQHVTAVIAPRQADGAGCTVLMAGGFELQLQETVEDVSVQINKRLKAY